jgi:hypothetical protein
LTSASFTDQPVRRTHLALFMPNQSDLVDRRRSPQPGTRRNSTVNAAELNGK